MARRTRHPGPKSHSSIQSKSIPHCKPHGRMLENIQPHPHRQTLQTTGNPWHQVPVRSYPTLGLPRRKLHTENIIAPTSPTQLRNIRCIRRPSKSLRHFRSHPNRRDTSKVWSTAETLRSNQPTLHRPPCYSQDRKRKHRHRPNRRSATGR